MASQIQMSPEAEKDKDHKKKKWIRTTRPGDKDHEKRKWTRGNGQGQLDQ